MDGIRNRWNKGRFLVIDFESGMTRYSDKLTQDYTGAMVTRRHADYEQPQDFIRPSDDPVPIPFSNPGLQDFTVTVSAPVFVGNTSVTAKPSPATHLF